jgi:hypothetical protein
LKWNVSSAFATAGAAKKMMDAAHDANKHDFISIPPQIFGVRGLDEQEFGSGHPH